MLTDRRTRDYCSPGTDERQASNPHVAGKGRSWAHVGTFAYPTVMINGGMSIDYRKIIYASFRIDNRAGHYSNAITQFGAHGDYCRGANCVYNFKINLPKIIARLQSYVDCSQFLQTHA